MSEPRPEQRRATGVALAIVTSVSLVTFSVVITTAPATAGLWTSNALGALSVFAAIVLTGTTIRRHRSRR